MAQEKQLCEPILFPQVRILYAIVITTSIWGDLGGRVIEIVAFLPQT
jgi:hypothetical protein